MIQEVKRSIHFTAYTPERGRKEDTDPAPVATISVKVGTITFPKRTVDILQMEKKFIAFYYEPTRKIIGFRLRSELSDGEIKLGKWRLVKIMMAGKKPGTPIYKTSIQGILRNFKGLSKDSYKKVEIKKYVETASMLDKGQVTYFIELKDEYKYSKENQTFSANGEQE